MAREIMNDCVGCETCRGCGRNHDYEVITCDECGAENLENEFLDFYEWNGEVLCEDCLDHKNFDPIPIGACKCCGKIIGKSYNGYCHACFRRSKMPAKITTEEYYG